LSASKASCHSTPPLAVIVLDPGGEINTLAFNALDHNAALRRLALDHRKAFWLLLDGLRRRDWQAGGEATTLSSRLHKAILPLLKRSRKEQA
jgi:uncharacterized protein involved in propanediol utilization